MVRISLCNPRSMKSLTLCHRWLRIDPWSLNERWVNRYFPTTELAQIGDETADGIYIQRNSPRYRILMRAASIFPCAVAPLYRYASWTFSAVRLVTNYTRYVDEFVRWGCSQILDLIVPTLPFLVLAGTGSPPKRSARRSHFRPCMEKTPDASMHLITADGQGITLVNIGVGPSMQKPSAIIWRCYARMSGWWWSLWWLTWKPGHWRLCTCTRYLRDDHVLDAVLPPDIPIPRLLKCNVRFMTLPS